MIQEEEFDSHCGFVALIGRPNVGKSSLLNCLIGEKISIVADKPQTTRHRVLGVKTKDTQQAVFIDTPGMHQKEARAMNRVMNKAARSALQDVDVVLFLVEALQWTKEDQMVLEKVSKLSCPVYLIVNKVDKVKQKEKLLPYLESVSQKMTFQEVIPISAMKNVQVPLLEEKVFSVLPKGPFYFSEEQSTDQSIESRLAEIIREKLTWAMSAEVPYALAVQVERMEVDAETGRKHIYGIIWVEKDSQKRIVIGSKGEQLKRIGQQARLDMNNILNENVHLELWVKVRDGWSDDTAALKNLGYLDLSD